MLSSRPVLWRALNLLTALLILGIALPAVPVLALRWLTPPTTAFMLLQHGPIDSLSYEWRDRGEISRNLVWAVIASEDQKFFQHHGFDLESIRDAVDGHRAGEVLRGASTITQQVAKNLFLWPSHSLLRKGIEAYLTLLIELCWTKERILEIYLNVAQFGEGLFGAEAAAQRVFGSPAAELSNSEAALLAAVLPSPRRLHAGAPSPYLRGRQVWILTQMGKVRAEAQSMTTFAANAGCVPQTCLRELENAETDRELGARQRGRRSNGVASAVDRARTAARARRDYRRCQGYAASRALSGTCQ